MPRKIVVSTREDIYHALQCLGAEIHPERQEGWITLVSDPHDGSGKERWFVECNLQLRFASEADARGFYQRLMTMTTAKP